MHCFPTHNQLDQESVNRLRSDHCLYHSQRCVHCSTILYCCIWQSHTESHYPHPSIPHDNTRNGCRERSWLYLTLMLAYYTLRYTAAKYSLQLGTVKTESKSYTYFVSHLPNHSWKIPISQSIDWSELVSHCHASLWGALALVRMVLKTQWATTCL